MQEIVRIRQHNEAKQESWAGRWGHHILLLSATLRVGATLGRSLGFSGGWAMKLDNVTLPSPTLVRRVGLLFYATSTLLGVRNLNFCFGRAYKNTGPLERRLSMQETLGGLS